MYLSGPYAIIGAVAVSATVLAGCQTTVSDAATTVDRGAVSAATTSTELMQLGAQQLDGAQIRSVFIGDTHDAGDWLFTINEDGTWSARAKDGSWTDTPGTWTIENDRFCRVGPDTPRQCQMIFQTGNLLRAANEDGITLRPWTIAL